MKTVDAERELNSVSASSGRLETHHAPLEKRVESPTRTGVRVARAMHEAAQVLRIIVSLHSAKDFTSVLRLYGLEGSVQTE